MNSRWSFLFMKCYVTGGTGFLGKNLIKYLLSQKHSVRALVRKTSQAEDLKSLGVDLVYGDVADPDVVKETIQGSDWVFHTAAMVKIWSDNPKEYYRVNVDGMRNIVDVASLSACKKIIYTSSFIALGPTDGVIADEKFRCKRTKFYNLYQETKFLAHREAARYCGGGLPFIPLYPGIIYGPGELTEGNIIAHLMLDFMKGKFPGILGSGNQLWNYVYVDDVVRGHVLAAEKGTISHPYILGGENVSLNNFVKTLAEVTEKPTPKRHIPFGLAKAVGAVEESLAHLTNRTPKATRGTIEIFKHDWALTSEKAQKELGYTYISLKEGLQKTYLWLKENNKI